MAGDGPLATWTRRGRVHGRGDPQRPGSRGEIRTQAEALRLSPNRDGEGDTSSIRSPSDFLPKYDLSNSQGGIYAVTDDVSDEQSGQGRSSLDVRVKDKKSPSEFNLRAKTWLAMALDHGDIEQIVELKSQAEAIRIYTMQKQLGKDAQLSAAEIVRRAERGLGVAVRRGQEAGQIKTRSDGGWNARNLDDRVTEKKSPADIFAGHDEASDAYALTDNVTDEQFDCAIDAARDEENLSRANVVRKVKSKERPKALVVMPVGD